MQKSTSAQRREADQLLCARIADLVKQMEKNNYPCFTRFLDEREQALAEKTLRSLSVCKEQYYFWTGFSHQDSGEGHIGAVGRRMLGIFPDYLALTEGMDKAILEEQFPIKAVTLSYRSKDALTHRDILGALMGLDIKRELVGEILTGDDFSVIFCTETAQQLILSELDKAGRAGLRKQDGYSEPLPPMYRLEYQTGTVSSLRLDCAVSLALNVSRDKSASLIEGGLVNLNFFEENKISKEVREGDILSIRGYGRYVLSQVGSLSKKGRIHLTVGKYI